MLAAEVIGISHEAEQKSKTTSADENSSSQVIGHARSRRKGASLRIPNCEGLNGIHLLR